MFIRTSIKCRTYEYLFSRDGGAVGQIVLGTINVINSAPLIISQSTINFLEIMTGGATTLFDLGITGDIDYFTVDNAVPMPVSFTADPPTSNLPLNSNGGEIILNVKNEPLTGGRLYLTIAYFEYSV